MPDRTDLTMKILIVDDSAAMRRCIAQLLPATDEKFECSDGKAAVAGFAAHKPDWVLMDIEMPGLDGLGAARQIKKQSPEARIIFVTAHDRPRLRAAALELNAAGFVLKDNLEEINHIVARKAGSKGAEKSEIRNPKSEGSPKSDPPSLKSSHGGTRGNPTK
jgi:DNA-binding NarL/FixJ family response regulator